MQFGGLLETRVKEGRAAHIDSTTFRDWSMVSNYEFNRLGRIWVIWNAKVKVNVSCILTTCYCRNNIVG